LVVSEETHATVGQISSNTERIISSKHDLLINVPVHEVTCF